MTVNKFQKHIMITHSKASPNLSLSTPRSKEGDKGFTSCTHTFTDHVTSISNISITGKRELQISLRFKYHINFGLCYTHFEITSGPCNLIGSNWCDLLMNPTIFYFKLHLFPSQ